MQPKSLARKLRTFWGAHAPSRVPIGASPMSPAPAIPMPGCVQPVPSCGEAPQAAREARALPISTCETLELATRRQFLARTGMMLAAGACLPQIQGVAVEPAPPKKVAAIVTVYTHNSHADVIAGRLLETTTLDGKGRRPNLQLASLYLDQTPAMEKGQRLAAEHGVRLCKTIAEALTLGGSDLAVDGVLLIGEHGNYPRSENGQIMYPRRRFFEETAAVFRQSRRVVPVFSDKHLSWNWEDAKWMYDTARELKIPFMAGSSLPTAWRHPPLDVPLGAILTQAVGIAYGGLDAYGFHALEMLQCLAERRRGGEVGVTAVQCLEGGEVWKALDADRSDRQLFDAALARREHAGRVRGKIEEVVANPVAFLIEYRDGFRAKIVMLNPAVDEFAISWQGEGKPEPQSTLFWLQPSRPYGHFTFLVEGVERMMHTGKPAWPVERTLLTTGLLDALLTSKLRGGQRIETPHLAINYQPSFIWREPPPPAPDRPSSGP